jgi:hypothetical protein
MGGADPAFSGGAHRESLCFCRKPVSTGLRRRRADREAFSVPGILVVDNRPVEQFFFTLVVNKLKALQTQDFIVFTRFVQNQAQRGPRSAVALLGQPDGFRSESIENFKKFRFCRFRNRYINHFFPHFCLKIKIAPGKVKAGTQRSPHWGIFTARVKRIACFMLLTCMPGPPASCCFPNLHNVIRWHRFFSVNEHTGDKPCNRNQGEKHPRPPII